MNNTTKAYWEIKDNYDRGDVFDAPSCAFSDLCKKIGAKINSKKPMYGRYTLPDHDGRVRATLPDGRIISAVEVEEWHGGEHSGHATYYLNDIEVV